MSDSKVPLICLAGGVVLGIGLTAFRSRKPTYKPPDVWVEAEIKTSHGSNRATAGAQTTKPLPKGEHPIQLYSLGTPNGVKPTIVLEEICDAYPDFDYDAWKIGIGGDQFTSGFVDVNPNSKIPALLDYTTSPPTRVFESGAILVYLAEKYPDTKLLPEIGSPLRAECLSWVFWAIGSPPFLGGGFGHFYSKRSTDMVEHLEYPINRYTQETKRQMDVLDKRLANNKYICGDAYSLADIAIWPWYGALVMGRMYGGPAGAKFLQVQTYKNLLRWAKLMEDRAAVRRGRMVNRGAERKESANASDHPGYQGVPNLPERHSRKDWEPR